MNQTVTALPLAALLLLTLAVAAPAATDHTQHQPAEEPAAAAAEAPEAEGHGMMHKMDMMKQEMMAEKMSGMSKIDHGMMDKDECMMHAEHHGSAMDHGMMPMDHGMMAMAPGMKPMHPGMMQQRMDHVFFLDRVDELGLSTAQVTQLKAVRGACRSDNIRQAAELQITRIELKEMLAEPDWTLKNAEPLVRRAQQLEADMLVRHLEAVQEAREVLTAEQLKQADAGMSADLEGLFQ